MAEEISAKKIKLDADGEAKAVKIKPLSHQVAGHSGTASQQRGFYECEDGTILKALHPDPDPRGPREVAFYQKVFDKETKDPVLLELRSFLPKYVGLQTKEEQNRTIKYLQLEDITTKFEKPCVIDIKIGKITYDPDATPEKKARESSKYPPLQKTGFQLRGFRVYNASKGDFDLYTKKEMQGFDENTILTGGLKVFFSPNGELRTDLVAHCVDKLLGIRKWFEKQTEFAFFASSLLIAFDGESKVAGGETNKEAQHSEANGENEADANKKSSNDKVEKNNETKKEDGRVPIEVRMIDFAHVFPGNGIDENYSWGLKSLINYLKQLVEK